MGFYKKLRKNIRKSYKKGKKIYIKGKLVYAKTKPTRIAMAKRARTTSSNIDNYWKQSQRDMKKIAGNYKF